MQASGDAFLASLDAQVAYPAPMETKGTSLELDNGFCLGQVATEDPTKEDYNYLAEMEAHLRLMEVDIDDLDVCGLGNHIFALSKCYGEGRAEGLEAATEGRNRKSTSQRKRRRAERRSSPVAAEDVQVTSPEPVFREFTAGHRDEVKDSPDCQAQEQGRVHLEVVTRMQDAENQLVTGTRSSLRETLAMARKKGRTGEGAEPKGQWNQEEPQGQKLEDPAKEKMVDASHREVGKDEEWQPRQHAEAQAQKATWDRGEGEIAMEAETPNEMASRGRRLVQPVLPSSSTRHRCKARLVEAVSTSPSRRSSCKQETQQQRSECKPPASRTRSKILSSAQEEARHREQEELEATKELGAESEGPRSVQPVSEEVLEESPPSLRTRQRCKARLDETVLRTLPSTRRSGAANIKLKKADEPLASRTRSRLIPVAAVQRELEVEHQFVQAQKRLQFTDQPAREPELVVVEDEQPIVRGSRIKRKRGVPVASLQTEANGGEQASAACRRAAEAASSCKELEAAAARALAPRRSPRYIGVR